MSLKKFMKLPDSPTDGKLGGASCNRPQEFLPVAYELVMKFRNTIGTPFCDGGTTVPRAGFGTQFLCGGTQSAQLMIVYGNDHAIAYLDVFNGLVK